MEMVQCDSALSYVVLSALFSGLVIHKIIRNKVKIENSAVSCLLSLLLLEIICCCVLCSHLGLTLFILACAFYYISIPVRRMLPPQGKVVLITGLWGIVHNAGVLGYMADGELLPISVYKQCMDVNFIGVVQVTKIFMPLLRKAKGRLVTISSMAGHTPIPGFAAYAASKAALSMFSAVMRQDLLKWSVKVSAIHPSGFKTNIFGSQEHWSSQDQNIQDNIMPDVKEDYGEEYLASLKDLHHTMSTVTSPDLSPVLEDVCHALLAQEPYVSYTPGQCAYLIPCLFHYFPLWVYDCFAKQTFQIHQNILPRSLRISKANNKTD
ncbi:17-beta-hydroxysteroid dehydrogenase type 2 isoform X3 [Hyla sarda]|uniref:17-beta-hydroxysteroid dehydrogenase type 2 isoform X3 n=1 Tax=Hyla sarda TaxID=327740 RepID=UPI0024C2E733|nr:17-beta-hydroxysteroid dehydrogenase type 2 isoform X3 [Hyla sarda]